MVTTTTELLPSYLDVTKLAVASFLARYREPTLTACTRDLKAFLGWCHRYDLEVLWVTRGELEMYVRHLEGRGYAAATIACRFGTVATCYRYAVIDGVIPANPADAVSRPKVAWEGQKRTVLHVAPSGRGGATDSGCAGGRAGLAGGRRRAVGWRDHRAAPPARAGRGRHTGAAARRLRRRHHSRDAGARTA